MTPRESHIISYVEGVEIVLVVVFETYVGIIDNPDEDVSWFAYATAYCVRTRVLSCWVATCHSFSVVRPLEWFQVGFCVFFLTSTVK